MRQDYSRYAPPMIFVGVPSIAPPLILAVSNRGRFCWSGVLPHWNSPPDPKRVSVTCFWSRWSRSLSWKLSNGNSEDDAAMQRVDGELVNPSRGLHRVIEDAKNNGWDVEYVHSDSDSCAWDGKIVMTWRSYTTWVNTSKTNYTQSNLPCPAGKRKR